VEERRSETSWLHPATSLSSDGLYVLVTDDRIAIDPTQLLDVEFTLPTGATIRTRVRIAYSDDRGGQRGVGLQFVELQAEERKAIEASIVASIHTRARRIT
jgi:hypothetical protein